MKLRTMVHFINPINLSKFARVHNWNLMLFLLLPLCVSKLISVQSLKICFTFSPPKAKHLCIDDSKHYCYFLPLDTEYFFSLLFSFVLYFDLCGTLKRENSCVSNGFVLYDINEKPKAFGKVLIKFWLHLNDTIEKLEPHEF